MSFKINDIPITVTMFPDNTSQVWKIPEKIMLAYDNNIYWDYSHEGEIVHLAQIVDLLRTKQNKEIRLEIDYLPYARQDKEISNTTTFAGKSFARLLNSLNIEDILILDPHSKESINCIENHWEVKPTKFIKWTEEEVKPDIICFPDKGAWDRYMWYNNKKSIYAEKVRNQLTGQIESVKVHGDVKDKVVLIVDDICDGGATFINLAKVLLEQGAKEVNLYVTHGIFSKGLKVLTDAGITRVFTKNGEITEQWSNGYGYERSITYQPWKKENNK